MRPENADGKKYRRFALDISSEHAARLPPGERPDQGPLLDVLALKPAKCRFSCLWKASVQLLCSCLGCRQHLP